MLTVTSVQQLYTDRSSGFAPNLLSYLYLYTRYERAASYLGPVISDIFSMSTSNISATALQQWQTRQAMVQCANDISSRCTLTLFPLLPCLTETLLMHMNDDYAEVSECAQKGINFLRDLHGIFFFS